MTMKNIYFTDLLPEQEIDEILKTREIGLESIRFSIADNLDRFSETLKEEQSRLGAFGNPPLSLHGPFLDLNPMCYDRLVREATFTRFSQAYEAAALLGATRIVYHSGMIPTVYYLEGWAQRMAEFWNRFLDGKSGITVCMENVLDRYAAPLAQVCSLVDHPDFGICLDLGHAWCYGEDPLSVWLDTLKGHIRHVHVHDNCQDRDRHLALGSGTLPYAQVIPALIRQVSTFRVQQGSPSYVQQGSPSYVQQSSSSPVQSSLSWTIECNTKDDVLRSLAAMEAFLPSTAGI